VLNDFCHNANCSDGASAGPVIIDGAGNFFGVTGDGKYGLVPFYAP